MLQNFPGKMVEEEEEEELITHDCYDLKTLLGGSEQGFLVRKNGDQVKVDNLKGKMLGLYFSASWCRQCQKFTPDLVEVYDELSVWEIPHLVILDENGKVVSDEGVETIRAYGVEAYPFSRKRIKMVEIQEEEAKKTQSLRFIMASPRRDYVISNDGKRDKICQKLDRYFHYSTLRRVVIIGPVGKTLHPNAAYAIEEYGTLLYPFTSEKFAELPERQKALEEAQTLESILAAFDENFSRMPWLELPYGDKRKTNLSRKLKVYSIPRVVAIGPTGRTICKNAVDLIDAYGADAYPFTDESLKENEGTD
ncbi:Thioredoxin-like fold containing protein [Parasponia andersonii]|uniref:protein-disulfide reductase n=1 Tax=Parasponia andersonii TaxID=3476 RepID=A0A2P5APR6_PARAD|nr:Thioredoxin-like fold containing protein [Parasponia andersonii]